MGYSWPQALQDVDNMVLTEGNKRLKQVDAMPVDTEAEIIASEQARVKAHEGNFKMRAKVLMIKKYLEG
jgi:hypothetical protein